MEALAPPSSTAATTGRVFNTDGEDHTDMQSGEHGVHGVMRLLGMGCERPDPVLEPANT